MKTPPRSSPPDQLTTLDSHDLDAVHGGIWGVLAGIAGGAVVTTFATTWMAGHSKGLQDRRCPR